MSDDLSPPTRMMLADFERAAFTNARQLEEMMLAQGINPAVLAMTGAVLLARTQYRLHHCTCESCRVELVEGDEFKVAARQMLEQLLDRTRLDFVDAKGTA